MSATYNWRTLAPQLIYYAYPDSDLLPIEPPRPEQAISEFKEQAGEAGDALFVFLCREADDDIDGFEFRDRLDRAIRDIEAVRGVVVGLLVNGLVPAASPLKPTE